MERKQALSFEALLAGTTLAAFLQELAMITDEEIADDLSSVKEGEIVLGEMTPMEKRVYAWRKQRDAKLAQDRELLRTTACVVCAACDTGEADKAKAACAEIDAFEAHTAMWYEMLWYSARNRFPGHEHFGIRKGFTVVAAPSTECKHTLGGVAIVRVNGGGLGELLRAMAGVTTRQ